MSPNQENLVDMAKQGDSKALAVLINRSLQPKGITAKTNLKDGCLQILVEADQAPNQESTIQFLVRGIKKLNIESLNSLKIFGKQKDQDFPDWSQEVILQRISNELSEVDDTAFNRQTPRDTELVSQAETAKQPTKSTSSKNLEKIPKTLTHIAKAPKKESNPPSQGKSKNIALKLLSSAWKWYISGFKSRPDLPLFLSPRLYRIVFTFFALFWITAPLGIYEETTSSSSGGNANSPSMASAQICIENFNQLMSPAATATLNKDDKTMEVVFNEPLTKQELDEVAPSLSNSVFESCSDIFIQSLKVESNGYVVTIRRP